MYRNLTTLNEKKINDIAHRARINKGSKRSAFSSGDTSAISSYQTMGKKPSRCRLPVELQNTQRSKLAARGVFFILRGLFARCIILLYLCNLALVLTKNKGG
jgi:hypothetical protein